MLAIIPEPGQQVSEAKAADRAGRTIDQYLIRATAVVDHMLFITILSSSLNISGWLTKLTFKK